LATTLGELCSEKTLLEKTYWQPTIDKKVFYTNSENSSTLLSGGRMQPDDISNECWADFLAHRKAKKTIVTQRVIDRIRVEAEKAGWTLEDALNECVDRGWQGFKAEWVQKKESNNDRKSALILGRRQELFAGVTIDGEVRSPLRLAKG
jgi:hypothetical protein